MFNILFQNGEIAASDSSFLQDLTTSAIGALIGAGGAILVYWLQIQRERDLKSTNQYEQNKSSIEYFKLVLNDAILFVKTQSELRVRYAGELNQEPFKTGRLNSFPTLPLFRLEKMNHEQTHNLFLSTQPDSPTLKFKNIYKYIDFYTESFKIIDSTIDKDVTEIQDLKQSYAKLFDELVDNVSKKINKIRYEANEAYKDYKTNPIFILLNEIIVNFYENRKDTTDLVYHQTQFVRKVTEGIVESKFLWDKDCLDLVMNSKNITFIFSDIKFKSKNLASYLIAYNESLQSNFKEFESAVNNITITQNSIEKRWYHIFYTPGK